MVPRAAPGRSGSPGCIERHAALRGGGRRLRLLHLSLQPRGPRFQPPRGRAGFHPRHRDGDGDLHAAHASGAPSFRRAEGPAGGTDHQWRSARSGSPRSAAPVRTNSTSSAGSCSPPSEWGSIFPTISVAVTVGCGPGERGLAGGLFVTAQQVGQAIGLAALATIAAAQTNAHHGSLASGYRAAYLVAVGFAALAVLIVAVLMRARRSPGGTV